MKHIILTFAITSTLSLSAQSFEWDQKGADAGAEDGTELAAYEAAYNQRQVGLAAAYPATAAGRPTRYEEVYQPAQLTAGHAVLPLGTLVMVTNLDNKKSVTVRINDAADDCQDCLITLSDAAAKELGINLRARVAVKRTGFSNWNPGEVADAPQTYGAGTVIARQTAPENEPVTIKGKAYGWDGQQTKPAPASTPNPAVVQPAVYTPAAQRPNDDPESPGAYARSTAPTGSPSGSVLDKEVTNDRAVPANPADYTLAELKPGASPRGQSGSTDEERTKIVVPVTAGSQSSAARPTEATLAASGAASSQRVTAPAAQKAQASPRQTTPSQAAPPAPTVPRYQQGRTIPAPQRYNAPTSAQFAKGVQAPSAPKPPAAMEMASGQVGHVVQLAAYTNEMYAQGRVEELRIAGMANVFYRSFNKADGSVIHRVYSGAFPSKAEAQRAADYIRDVHQIAGLVMQIN